MTNQEKFSKLKELLDEMGAYARVMGKVNYDMECIAPEEGIAQAGDDMAIVGKQYFKLSHAPEFTELVCALHEDGEGLSEVQKKAVEHLYDDYEKTKNFTPEFAFEFDTVHNAAFGDWIKAKKTGDFSLFRDNFAKTVDFTRKAIELRERKYPTPYTACLDDNERARVSSSWMPSSAHSRSVSFR